MPIVKMSELLEDARVNGYAVGCFNVVNMESFEAVLEAAEENASPVIITIAQIHMPYINIPRMLPMMKAAIEASPAKAVLLLDHAYDMEVVEKAVQSGMNAVMYDISMLPYEEHVKKMREIVASCGEKGVEVEGELGFVGRAKGSKDYEAEKSLKTNFSDQPMFTDPQQAKAYVEATGVKALAVSVGNTHGQYKASANLQYELLESLNEASPVPLVMHGSSGISDQDLAKAVKKGICKVNYYTGLSKGAVDAIRQTLEADSEWKDYHPLMKVAKDAIKTVVVSKMKILGSCGRG